MSDKQCLCVPDTWICGKHDVQSIRVWEFFNAPEYLKALSNNGGDEDWIALVPKSLAHEYIGWLQSGSSFGCCDVSEHQLQNGDLVYIGSHA